MRGGATLRSGASRASSQASPRLLRIANIATLNNTRDQGIHILARMAFAAGAKKVLLPIFGAPIVSDASEIEFLVHRPPKATRVECMAFHPLGSAKMSARSEDGVVRPTGESWAIRNLFVADGSVLPTSIGVNSQLPIMAVARRIAHGIADGWKA